MEIREFDEYHISYYAMRNSSLVARIVLLSGGVGVGWINFISESVSLPANHQHVNRGLILNFPESKFGDIVDILRYEEPLYVSLNVDNGVGALQTDREPIGEEESD